MVTVNDYRAAPNRQISHNLQPPLPTFLSQSRDIIAGRGNMAFQHVLSACVRDEIVWLRKSRY